MLKTGYGKNTIVIFLWVCGFFTNKYENMYHPVLFFAVLKTLIPIIDFHIHVSHGFIHKKIISLTGGGDKKTG
jgi:hypothetical protein